MTVTVFPIERTLEAEHQGDRREFVLMAIEGQPPERKKKLILEARRSDLISNQDCAAFLDACGLGAA